ncbi:MAG: bifunctional histidinol-phosphatase/imidazoleglycerol-phosphate dehydratase HisB [Bacteroidales bacterium]|nr:bifunctional histidinol-phosphatase/imidazoleglycerol-phosphate dehydratase HisB [Bacteroidales bacterium]
MKTLKDNQLKKALFLDRDGTLIVEPQDTFQVDSLERLEFIPGVFRNLYHISRSLDYELVIVSNQDGLGTPSYPEEAYQVVQDKVIQAFRNENIEFDNVLIDKSFSEENLSTRKPNAGLLTAYMDGTYNLQDSYVIGDRLTDLELARNIGARGILLGPSERMTEVRAAGLEENCAFIADHWDKVTAFLLLGERNVIVHRKTGETDILVELDMEGTGKTHISTGIGFFDHMLDQVARHSGCSLTITAKGDLNVDEHHTVEDTALALGEAFVKALGSKAGLNRYGFALPMDDAAAQVLIDFGGRPWIVWRTRFKREKVGDFPTELFFHFFKSFSDAARCNLHIRATGDNEHHKAEAIFKAFARALRMAIQRDPWKKQIPSTKGSL